MTVIAWDGKTLAADKMLDCNGYPATTTKIRRAPDGALFGGSGDSDTVRELADWFVSGAEKADFPQRARESGASGTLMVITPTGMVWLYVRGPAPIVMEDRLYAIGSGADFALAAMHLGHDARTAVELAIKLDNSCGNGIDTLQLGNSA